MVYEKNIKEYEGECPSCYYPISAKDVLMGEVQPCPDCGVDLEVIGINNSHLTYQVAEKIQEDWGE